MFLNNPLKPIPFLSEKWDKKYRVYPVNPVKFNLDSLIFSITPRSRFMILDAQCLIAKEMEFL